jgi:2-(1,2-epoxy-1,2-dihydrophenyl)acetyl-CoA isomerase
VSDASVTLTIADGVARVTLSEPDRGNPFDLAFCTELSRVAAECDARMNAPVVVAVHALAVGGGVALCAAADFCVAARSDRPDAQPDLVRR